MKKYFIALIYISLVIIAGCDRDQQAIAPEDLKQIALLPQNANVIGFTDYQKIHESPFFSALVDTSLNEWLANDDFTEFYQQTRLNLQKDIHKIWFAGKVYPHSSKFDGVLVARGNFDAEKIMNYIESQQKGEELAPEMYAGIKFYRSGKHQPDPFIFGFVDNEYFVGGVDSLVQKWVDLKKQGESKRVSDDLLARINRLKYKNSAWLIVDAKTILENLPGHRGPEQMIQKIRNLDCSFDVAETARFFGEVECIDAESATLFQDAIKGAISTMKLSATDDRDVIDILNQIIVKSGQQQIQISFQMTPQDIEKLKARKNILKLPTV